MKNQNDNEILDISTEADDILWITEVNPSKKKFGVEHHKTQKISMLNRNFPENVWMLIHAKSNVVWVLLLV